MTYRKIPAERHAAIRRAYLTPCPYCGRRPTHRMLAAQYGVRSSTICRIVAGTLTTPYTRRITRV